MFMYVTVGIQSKGTTKEDGAVCQNTSEWNRKLQIKADCRKASKRKGAQWSWCNDKASKSWITCIKPVSHVQLK